MLPGDAAARLRGSGRITWYAASGQRGRVVGGSVLVPDARGGQGYTPVDSLLTGSVTSGRLAGRRSTGTAVPTSDVLGCASRGVRSVAGRGLLSFS
ncbi:hypothetical protein ACFOSC_12565 [Streptantibioticus rubrisoli]|uniref:Uncharacterized protein n=1 Tax=Streptantibioticus rubrisoli TaxID=1387313 RepID=A0ABT1PAS0_9ACTN|nr:hypothetical protein [Streptantibioticus rubrisoli]MCQ4041538.1 hypothetical protein [Streptantibioticus rubrisoli]